MKLTVNLTADIEQLRQYVGLESLNLMRIVGQAMKIVKAKKPDRKKASPEEVLKWVMDNVNWGLAPFPFQRSSQQTHAQLGHFGR